MRARRDLRLHVFEPAVEILGHGLTRRIDVSAVSPLCDQARAFNLGFALAADEAVPLAAALAQRVNVVKYDLSLLIPAATVVESEPALIRAEFPIGSMPARSAYLEKSTTSLARADLCTCGAI
jgi:hypothetical protein